MERFDPLISNSLSPTTILRQRAGVTFALRNERDRVIVGLVFEPELDVCSDFLGEVSKCVSVSEYELAPSSINTDGARRIFDGCEEAEIDLEDTHGYLAPHGGRRGADEVTVRQRGFTAAVRLLDNSEEVVRTSYSRIEAKGIAEDAGDAFAEHET